MYGPVNLQKVALVICLSLGYCGFSVMKSMDSIYFMLLKVNLYSRLSYEKTYNNSVTLFCNVIRVQ